MELLECSVEDCLFAKKISCDMLLLYKATNAYFLPENDYLVCFEQNAFNYVAVDWHQHTNTYKPKA